MKIRNQIRPHDPKDLMRAMKIALDLEETINEERKGVLNYHNNASSYRYFVGNGVTTRVEPTGDEWTNGFLAWPVMLRKNLPLQERLGREQTLEKL